MEFSLGKVPPNTLEKIFGYLGTRRQDIMVGPSYGVDGAVVKVGNKHLVASMDPITGALERLGWLAVNINANDVATFGVEPSFFSSCLLLPENATEDTIETICGQIDAAAKDLGIAVIGGHAEITPNLRNPIVVGYCMGIAEPNRYVTAKGARAGNQLILTKTLGIEGTAILATDKHAQLVGKIGESALEKSRDFLSRISVVKEALLAYKTGRVTAMHDPTEGGVAGGIHELAQASGLGFRVHEEKMPVAEETLRICEFFQIDPLQLIASGSLLIAAEIGAKSIVDVLRNHKIPATVIGELLPRSEERIIVRKDGTIEQLVRPITDHLWRALRK